MVWTNRNQKIVSIRGITKKGKNETSNVKTLQRKKEGFSCTKTTKCCEGKFTKRNHYQIS